MKRHIPLILGVAVIMLSFVACSASPATSTAETNGAAGLPNPASVYCEEQGGRLEMRADENGTYGVCRFDNGSECEEWAYFRGECEPGVSDAETPSAGKATLTDTEWQLISLSGNPPLEGTQITLKFEESWLSGFAGCNGYGGGPDSGAYNAAAEGGLSIPAFAITVEFCPSPEGVMQQERAYVDALTNATAYRLTADGLEIKDAAGETVLTYIRREESDMDPSDLVGTAWQLDAMNGTRTVEGSSITLVFHDAHRVSGHAGCRDYVAAYQAEGNDLGFTFTAMLGAVCSEEALIEGEGDYTTALGWTDRFRLSEGKLELLSARGESLLFEPLPEEARAALEGPTWSLLAFVEPDPAEGMPAPLPLPTEPITGSEITVTFSEGKLTGSAGCNMYAAAYRPDGDSLAIEGLEFTEMACLDPDGVLQQEDHYLGVLKDVIAGHVYGGQLWLETSDGRALVFRVPTAD
jgi:heat shock protein HslJ